MCSYAKMRNGLTCIRPTQNIYYGNDVFTVLMIVHIVFIIVIIITIASAIIITMIIAITKPPS